ncbi:8283_t:CDS:1, partial [Gigaspora rosea]
ALVNKGVKQQLPSLISETLLRKRKERAQKIYDLLEKVGSNELNLYMPHQFRS